MNHDRVIIVGAGPSGLSLACALAKRGVRVSVYEALPDLGDEARASTLHAASLEMFDEWDVIGPILNEGQQVDRLQYWERSSRQLLAELPYRHIAGDTAYPFRLQLPQNRLARILKRELEQTGLASIHMGHRLVSLKTGGDRPRATFATAHGTLDVTPDYLCGADGSRSAVRTALGLGFEGLTYEDRFLLGATTLDLAPLFPGIGPVAYLFDPGEWVIILHLPEITRIVFRVEPGEDAGAITTTAHLRDRIAAFLGSAPTYEIRGVSLYRVHQRVADTFRVGRVLLLGDAAHINNPIGGMGMNSGIHDAYHLGEALGRVLNGEPDTLLDDYNRVRRAAAVEDVQRRSDQNYADMVAARDARLARNRHLSEIAASPDRIRDYLLSASMLGHRI